MPFLGEGREHKISKSVMFTESDHISRAVDETGVLNTEWRDVHTIYQTDIRQYQTVKRYLINQNGLKTGTISALHQTSRCIET